MNQNYSQIKAMFAIVKSSFLTQMKNPMTLFFGFAFPLFFILIFGGSTMQAPSSNLRFTSNSDTSNAFYQYIKKSEFYDADIIKDSLKVIDSLVKGRITAIVDIQKNKKDSTSLYNISILPSKATDSNIDYLKMMFDALLYNINKNIPKLNGTNYANIIKQDAIGNRVFKRIDYVLPGQLGFSLLTAGLFGVAFLFFNLRDTLVLKRLNATPIKRPYIILGEALARILFQLIIITLLILIGKFVFGFTLINGIFTYLQLLFICFIGLLVFMGLGFIISGVSKSINNVPLLTNLIGFPQMMLAGTFFPYKSLPSFIHPFSKILPLTYVNDALRKIAFEGQSLTACLPEIGIICLWIIVVYAIAFKVFKWE